MVFTRSARSLGSGRASCSGFCRNEHLAFTMNASSFFDEVLLRLQLPRMRKSNSPTRPCNSINMLLFIHSKAFIDSVDHGLPRTLILRDFEVMGAPRPT